MKATLKQALTSAVVATMVIGSASVALASHGQPSNNQTGGTQTTVTTFVDWQQVPDWAAEAITRMAVKGVMEGDDEHRSNPSAMITNAEAAAMVVRFLGQSQDATSLNATQDLNISDRSDVPDWAKGVVAWSLKNNLFEVHNGRFNPQHPLTRLEAARLLVMATKLQDEAASKQGEVLPYKDARQIPGAYVGYVAVAFDHGWMIGDNNGMFHPNKAITRAEWATLLNRADVSLDLTTDANQVKGAITAVNVGDAPTISVTTPVFPSGVTYPVDDTCKFFIGGQEATISDLQVGDSVLINLSPDRKVLAVTVVIDKQSVSGVVSAVTLATDTAPGSISLQSEGATVGSAVYGTAYEVDPSTVVTIGEVAGALADVKVGDQAALTLERGKVVAIKVNVAVQSYEGQIIAVAPSQDNALPSITVKTEDNQSQTWNVADFAQILAGSGDNITIADLQVGDRVELKVQRSLIIRIKVTE